MKPRAFEYHRPETLDEALTLLRTLGPGAKLLAGGQSLGPMLNMRLAGPSQLIDLNDLLDLDYVRSAGATLEIGAQTRHYRVAGPEVARANPLLAAAAATIGHYAIRQRGTLGGSLAHADPAAQIPLIAVAQRAELVIRGATGQRVVEAGDFLKSIMTVDLAPDEIITAGRFPRMKAGAGWGFELFSRRRGDFAVIAVAATVTRNGGSGGGVVNFGLSVGGAGPVPVRLDEALADLTPTGAPDPSWPAWVGDRVAALITPEDTPQVPADFRRDLARELTARALSSALDRAGEEGA